METKKVFYIIPIRIKKIKKKESEENYDKRGILVGNWRKSRK